MNLNLFVFLFLCIIHSCIHTADSRIKKKRSECYSDFFVLTTKPRTVTTIKPDIVINVFTGLSPDRPESCGASGTRFSENTASPTLSEEEPALT
jgi:hypothetical protein